TGAQPRRGAGGGADWAFMTSGASIYTGSRDPRVVVEAIATLGPGPGDLVGVLVGERDAPDLEALVAALRATPWSFFGGLFPALLDGGERRDAGVLAFSV